MEDVTAQRRFGVSQLQLWRDALNWFFREGRRDAPEGARRMRRRFRPQPNTLADVPSLSAADTGTEEWEQKLIRQLRHGQYRWRTEQAYRHWAGRFVRWWEAQRGGRVRPTGGLDVATVTELEIKDFLTELATRQRTSASSQKQALNALVFLLRDALGRELGDFSDFVHAARRERVPVVLSRDECRQLFAALDGSNRLMAELMYGSGVRLMELLGLRVKDVDLDRQQLIVRAGKGDKDRVTVLPETLLGRLREHRDWLRTLYDQDREQNAPGVWLPEGLERKFPKAGEAWEWQWFFAVPAIYDRSAHWHQTAASHLGRNVSAIHPASRPESAFEQAGHAARAAAFFRHPSAGIRYRHSHVAGIARPQRRGGNANLHPRHEEARPRCPQPAGRLNLCQPE
jgi:hypothetical protein